MLLSGAEATLHVGSTADATRARIDIYGQTSQGNGTRTHNGGRYLFNHNWLEFYDDVNKTWVFVNVPDTPTPNTGLCSFNRTTGCNYDTKGGSGCSNVNSGPGNAGQDHEIFARKLLLLPTKNASFCANACLTVCAAALCVHHSDLEQPGRVDE